MQPGAQIGPYVLLEPLGSGGMGEVWRARDQRLQRDVAVKVLPEASMRDEKARARFEREARAVAALSHPNILAIHDYGREADITYAVMEMLEGVTLRDRLTQSEVGLARALEWGHQIAQGLAAAHERGIVHRDLKPENIFITRDGLVKILDFGLARMERNEPDSSPDVKTISATSPGTIVGTLAYLSPEQARGATADARSDIFAFGLVLFEMLSGQTAFLRGTAADTLAAVLRDEPRPLSDFGKTVPGEVEEILAHCLEKNPDDRFRSARDLGFALRLATRAASGPGAEASRRTPPRAATAAPRPRDLSIAVLPFRNMSSDPDAEYFSDGMTEEIIHALSGIPALQVAARTSSYAFKGRQDDVKRIGSELGVAMVLEGSVRQSGSRLRVTAQLVSAENGYDLWSQRWDRDLADVFAVQDEIAQAIASTLKLRLGEGAAAGTVARTRDVQAYDHYLKGRYLWAQRHATAAIGALKAAIEADPDFADAHTALADAWAVRGFYGGVPTWEAWARARAALDEARRIDPEGSEIDVSLAILEHYYGWNSEQEERFCRRAIEKNPRAADGWSWLAIFFAASGRRDEALAAGARGIELEPHHANVRASQAWGHLLVGEFEPACALLEKAVEVDPTAGYARWSYGVALRFAGQLDRAIEVLDRLVTDSGRVPFYVSLMGGARAAAGDTAGAREILKELDDRRAGGEFVPSVDRATVLAALSETEATLGALEQARDERNALLWARIHFPDFAALRSHPRWLALARRLGRTAPFAGP